MSLIQSNLAWHVIYSHVFNDLGTLASFEYEDQAIRYINTALSERDHTCPENYTLIQGLILPLKEISRVKEVAIDKSPA